MAKEILLAEDSPDDELLFKRVMKANRIENPIRVVRDGCEAIAYLEGTGAFADRDAHPLPAILFLDLKMPRADGFDVLEWLKNQAPLKQRTLVVVLTQFGDTQQIRRAYELGANSFFPKPFKKEDLENLIQHYSGHWVRGHSSSGGAAQA
jgi:CheY-like chemotaxis protein